MRRRSILPTVEAEQEVRIVDRGYLEGNLRAYKDALAKVESDMQTLQEQARVLDQKRLMLMGAIQSLEEALK